MTGRTSQNKKPDMKQSFDHARTGGALCSIDATKKEQQEAMSPSGL